MLNNIIVKIMNFLVDLAVMIMYFLRHMIEKIKNHVTWSFAFQKMK